MMSRLGKKDMDVLGVGWKGCKISAGIVENFVMILILFKAVQVVLND